MMWIKTGENLKNTMGVDTTKSILARKSHRSKGLDVAMGNFEVLDKKTLFMRLRYHTRYIN
jgi:hypothetical protein